MDSTPLKSYFNSIAELDDQVWENVCKYFTGLSLPKGKFLVKPGEICDKIAFINQGCLRYYYNQDGKEVTVSFFTENEFVSAYQSFLEQRNSEQIVDVLEDAELLVLNYKDLQKLYTLYPKFERIGRTIMETLLLKAQERIHTYLLHTPEERYLNLLKNSPELIQRIPQHYIASYLGITPVSLSRIRKKIVTK